ncbi:MAG: T9SS type A sorting domain-containing protein [Sphingobacteriaceae bacterium]|nr:T9SS type A sorting domain-containing protein [Sphingobacteriaceae bacterium]
MNYSLYPNPANGEFTIKGNVENAEVTIYSILGKKVEHSVNSKTNSSIVVNCSSLASGVYFINVKQGSETKIQKLIIE